MIINMIAFHKGIYLIHEKEKYAFSYTKLIPLRIIDYWLVWSDVQQTSNTGEKKSNRLANKSSRKN